MCSKALREYARSLGNFPDWFVRIKLVEMWYDDKDYCSDGKFTKLYNGYKKKINKVSTCRVIHFSLLGLIGVCQRTRKRFRKVVEICVTGLCRLGESQIVALDYLICSRKKIKWATLMSPGQDETRICGYIYIYVYMKYIKIYIWNILKYIYILKILKIYIK